VASEGHLTPTILQENPPLPSKFHPLYINPKLYILYIYKLPLSFSFLHQENSSLIFFFPKQTLAPINPISSQPPLNHKGFIKGAPSSTTTSSRQLQVGILQP